MTLRMRNAVLLLKKETTYATDASPTGSANAVQAWDVELAPLEGERVSMDIIDGFMGSTPDFQATQFQTMNFKVALAASGTAGTAPAWGPGILACGMAETVVADTSVTYTPISVGGDACTIHYFMDGQRHVLLGSRGNVQLMTNARAIPYLQFTMTGLHAIPTAVSNPTGVYTNWKRPLIVNNAQTPDFTLHTASLIMNTLSLNLGNSVVHENMVNSEDVEITDRAASGAVQFRAPDLSTLNVFSIAKSGATGALSLVHGTVAGSIIELAAPAVQLLRPRFATNNGKAHIDLDLRLNRSAGNDELSIICR